MGNRRGAYKDFVGRPEGNRPLITQRRRLDVIETDFQEVGWGNRLYLSDSV
jgi:hypothetical protein